jgi:sulfate adenylyltransferase subunit 1 (EFTu-like GTPase family)
MSATAISPPRRAPSSSRTRRHATICSLFGIRDMILAVNKIDLVAF